MFLIIKAPSSSSYKGKEMWCAHHYKHRTFWFMRANDARYVLYFSIAYVSSLSQYIINFRKEIILCIFNDLRNCSLIHVKDSLYQWDSKRETNNMLFRKSLVNYKPEWKSEDPKIYWGSPWLTQQSRKNK